MIARASYSAGTGKETGLARIGLCAPRTPAKGRFRHIYEPEAEVKVLVTRKGPRAGLDVAESGLRAVHR